MDNATLLETIRQNNQIVKVLSDKNGDKVMKLYNPTAQKYMVLRMYEKRIPAYIPLKMVHHPNFPEIYDVVDTEGGQIVFEEFVDGITIADVIETGKYTYQGMKKVLNGVCSAVAYLHDLGIVHRDIKPENVMIGNSGQIKLIDLNASRSFDVEKNQDTQVLGTIGYASPEQLGIAQCDMRTDIYALGVLINVMLTGQHPSQKLAKGKAGRIVLKCTQIDPDSRFQSVEKLIQAL